MSDTIIYKDCTIGGEMASALLQFKEDIAAAVNSAQDAIDDLDSFDVDATDENVTLSGIEEVALANQNNVTDAVVFSEISQGGTQYASEPQAAQDDGAIAHWKLDETSGAADAADSTAFGRDLTVNGTIAPGTGKIDGDRVFTGTQWFEWAPPNPPGWTTSPPDYIEYDETFKFRGDMSFCGWIYISNGTVQNPIIAYDATDPGAENKDYNSLYTFYVETDGTLRLFWEYSNGTNVLINSGLTLATGRWYFVGFVREDNGVGGRDGFIVLGDDQGNFNDYFFSGLTAPEGGDNSRLRLGARYSGGATYAQCSLDDCVLYHDVKNPLFFEEQYNRGYEDYIIDEGAIRRSIVSDIPDGDTVYVSYTYTSGIDAVQDNADAPTGRVDDALSDSKTDVKNTTQLAASLELPTVSASSDADYNEQRLGNFGLNVVNGNAIIEGETDTTAYLELVDLVTVSTADSLLASKTTGDFILISLEEVRTESTVYDSCGDSSTQINISYRIAGTDIPLSVAAENTTSGDADDLLLRLWWVGEIANDSHKIDKLSRYGVEGDELTSALRGINTDRMTVYVIGDPALPQQLSALGMTEDDVTTLSEREPPSINAEPTDDERTNEIKNVLGKPGGSTPEGDPSFESPALLVAATIDLDKTYQASSGLAAADFGDIDADTEAQCTLILAILDEAIKAIEQAMALIKSSLAPLALNLNINLGTLDLSYDKYIECLVSANIGVSGSITPPGLGQLELLALAAQISVLIPQVLIAVGAIDNILCLPRELLNALAGGICDLNIPSDLPCQDELDALIAKLKSMLDMARDIITSLSGELNTSAGQLPRIQSNLQSLLDAPVTCFPDSIFNVLKSLGR
jgi:hypothetical protein